MSLIEQQYTHYKDYFNEHAELHLYSSMVTIEEMYQHFKDRIMDDIDEKISSEHD